MLYLRLRVIKLGVLISLTACNKARWKRINTGRCSSWLMCCVCQMAHASCCILCTVCRIVIYQSRIAVVIICSSFCFLALISRLMSFSNISSPSFPPYILLRLSTGRYVCMTCCLPIFLPICFSVSLNIYLSVCLSVCSVH